ncbi:MAG TPA: hypothetical protein VHA75_13065 [Rugosimonospora sp.]|nr:hypothetical protein [Rugosimonospora sp.]
MIGKEHPTVHQQPTTLGRFGPWLGGSAIVVWLAAVALVAVDAIRPGFPTPVTIAVLLVAATITITTVVLIATSRADARVGEMVEALGRYAALLEQQQARQKRDVPRGRSRRGQPRDSQRQHPASGLPPQVLDLTRRIDRKIRGSAS